MPIVGVLPMARHGLPEEDGVAATAAARLRAAAGRRRRLSAASNLDEFQPLAQAAGCASARRPPSRRRRLVVLPGTKHRRRPALAARARLRAPLRMRPGRGARAAGDLRRAADARRGAARPGRRRRGRPGLGLLPLATTFEPAKLLARTRQRFAALEGPWRALSGLAVDGYQIHAGRTVAEGEAEALEPGLGWADGPVLGIAPHGIFEQPEVLAAVLGTESEADALSRPSKS